MIYLDTHAVLWLYAGELSQFSQQGRQMLADHDLVISRIVRLELQYLYEIQRATAHANEIVEDLSNRVGLQTCEKNFTLVIEKALHQSWTRDPFDRIIVANAALDQDILLSKDRMIRSNYEFAQW